MSILIILGVAAALILQFAGLKWLLIFAVLAFSAYLLSKRTLYGILLYIPAALYFGYMHIYGLRGITPRTLILLLFILLLFINFNKKKFIESLSNKIILIMSAVIVYILFFDLLLYNQGTFNLLYNIVQDFGIPIVILIFLLNKIKNIKDMNLINKVLIFALAISAIVAIGQFFNIEFFWNLRKAILPEIPSLPMTPGLAYFSITLSYQLAIIFPLSLALYLYNKKNIYLLSTIILGVGAIVSRSRSCILALFIATIIGLIIIRKDSKILSRLLSFKFLIPLLLILILIAPLLPLQSIPLHSISGRSALVVSSVLVSIKHPFGAGPSNYMEKAAETFPLLQPYFKQAKHVLLYTPHNQYLNIFGYYGWIVFGLLIYFTALLLKYSYNSFKNTKNKQASYLSLGLFLSIIAFIINSLFHNNGFFMGETIIFIIIAEILFVKWQTQRSQS